MSTLSELPITQKLLGLTRLIEQMALTEVSVSHFLFSTWIHRIYNPQPNSRRSSPLFQQIPLYELGLRVVLPRSAAHSNCLTVHGCPTRPEIRQAGKL